MQVRSLLSLCLTAVLTMPPLVAQSPAPLKLSIEEIMRGPALYGYAPRAVRFSGDGSQVYFQWKRAADAIDKDFDTYVVNKDGSGLRRLTDEEARVAPPLGGAETKDHRRVVYADRGDLFLYDRAAGKRRTLTHTTEVESNPRFTRDEKRVAFVRANNLYTLSLEDGTLEQLTDIRAAAAAAGAGPSAAPPPVGQFQGRGQGQGQGQGQRGAAATGAEARGTESQEALKKAERALLEIIEQKAKKREQDEEKRKKEEPRKPFQLTVRQSAGAMQLSPDESVVLAAITETAEGSKNAVVPNYVTESGYTEDISSRSKAGDTQARLRLALINVTSGEVKWVDPGLKEKDAAGKEIDRAVQLNQPVFNEDGSRLVLNARSADNKDRWIFAADPVTGKCRELFHQRDEAWINGPGSFTLGWLADNQTIYFQSERDGWSHLYTVSSDGGEPKQLTTGKWEVDSVTLSTDKTRFWMTTSEGSVFERHFYSMSVGGGARTKITVETGQHEAVVSPDETWIADVYSFTNKPPELYLAENRPGAPRAKVTDSPAPEFFTYPWSNAAPIQVPARDGAQVPAFLYKPEKWKPGGPAVIFVHGAGYVQNVHRGWSSYAREFMFHHFLREQGYLVLALDYRGSAGNGRDWRAAIYRHMGGKDLDDQVDAAKWMVKEHGVDAKRIGLYGGSYGGFITLMAMFTQPDVFAAGAALRPVTDWAHYNHQYTSNILNNPQKDAEAYKVSSPIYHAAGLKGALLICHGLVDTNVHFQDSARLVQRLIELKKDNWELAVFPVEDHSFIQPSSWIDEYKRIFKLFETNLKKGWTAPSAIPAKGKRKTAPKTN